jgi:hypothetical protein
MHMAWAALVRVRELKAAMPGMTGVITAVQAAELIYQLQNAVACMGRSAALELCPMRKQIGCCQTTLNMAVLK